MEIIKTHEEVLSYLLDLRKTDESLYFVPRKINNGQRLENGYWFLGNDHYIHLSFWNGLDWKEKIHNIGFVIHDDGTSKIELSAQDDPGSKARFLQQIANNFKGFVKHDSKNKWFKYYTDTDYIKHLDDFVRKFKPQIDQLIKRSKPRGISLIDDGFFNKYMRKIFDLRDAFDHGVYDDLFKNSNGKPRRKGTRNKNTDDVLVSHAGRYIRKHTHNIIQKEIYDLLVRTHGEEKVKMEENCVDIIITDDHSTELIEVKPYESVILCIREGLGQLLSYYYKHYIHRENVSLTIVGRNEPGPDEIGFINFIKTNLNIEFKYKSREMGFVVE